MAAMEPATLITITFSHFCEKARWALQHVGLPFREDGHLPILHYAATRRVGAGRTVPVLVHRGRVIGDSTDILLYLDGLDGAQRGAPRLYPPESSAARAECLALEDRFDRDLGPATRRVAYFHLLPSFRAQAPSLRAGLPPLEAALLGPLLPLAAPLMAAALRRGLGITPDGARRSQAKLDAVLDLVDRQLADGRPYLLGADFSAADLTFAALLGPVLLPPGYGGPLPSLADAPASLRALAESIAARPAGALALRAYRDHRRPAP